MGRRITSELTQFPLPARTLSVALQGSARLELLTVASVYTDLKTEPKT